MVGLDRHAIRRLAHGHQRVAGQQVHHHAFVGGIEMLDQDESHAGAGRQGLHELSAGVEAARVGRVLRVRLKYTEDRKPVIQGIERVSRPGRRQYVEAGTIPKVQGGMGTTIVSTSHGVMTGHEAKRAGIGGELVARVW
jgi:ribosomal protein S8